MATAPRRWPHTGEKRVRKTIVSSQDEDLPFPTACRSDTIGEAPTSVVPTLMKHLRNQLVTSVALLLGSGLAYAQTRPEIISGRVVGDSGAVVSGASII